MSAKIEKQQKGKKCQIDDFGPAVQIQSQSAL
jgi:hypothetical protein